MNITSGTMPQNVKRYVAMGTKLVNLLLFLCHIGYGILFWVYDAKVLFYYNCIHTLLFIFACVMLERKKKWTYIVTVFLGIFIFMVLAVVYLGWDYGFQQYCIGFVASLIFTNFYMNRERKITRGTMMIIGLNVLLYVVLRLWTYEHPFVYKIDNGILMKCFYIFNSLIGFAFLIMYLCIYSSTVHRLENSLMEMASVDPLTGISNRRKMQQMLESVLEEYETQQYQTVIAMLDIDFFKKINDTYGMMQVMRFW
ncbi:MAG: GGDEF domain-containing protein [Lachnospiraceae bacterium]|nr:GGDEF domain-containing protein [Lachnospiraceae bacterium]